MNNINDSIRLALKGEPAASGRPRFIYTSNGADGTRYDDLLSKGALPGGFSSPEKGPGKHRIVFEHTLNGDSDPYRVMDIYTHSDAEFAGFSCRKKVDDKWLWFCEDGEWHGLDEYENTKRLFSEGSSVSCLDIQAGDTLLLDAQWKSAETGEYINSGYRIFSNKLMAHALGDLDGISFTNTFAAFRHSLENGFDYFEVDLTMTEDGHLVLMHGWDSDKCASIGIPYEDRFKHMTYEMTRGLTVHGEKVADAKEFYELVKSHPDCYFEIDLHPIKNHKKAKKVIEALVSDFNNDEEALNRLLIQAYNRTMYVAAEEVYPFKYYQYLLGMVPQNLEKKINASLEDGMCALALRFNYTYPGNIAKAHFAGLYTLAYSVNEDLAEAEHVFESGTDTLCTDFLTPENLEEPAVSYGEGPFSICYNAGMNEFTLNFASKKSPRYYTQKIRNRISNKNLKENWKKHETVTCPNDGEYVLPDKMSGAHRGKLIGWYLRMSIEDKMYWLCEDGYYHLTKDILTLEKLHGYLFEPGEALPVLTVRPDTTIIMEAVFDSGHSSIGPAKAQDK